MDDAPMLHTPKGKPDTTARHVLQALAEHAHPNGKGAHPSVMRLQYRTGYDRSTVQRALRRLEDGKLIQPDGIVGGRTQWRLSMWTVRPKSDWADLETAEDAQRAAVAERVRRHRAKRAQPKPSPDVTHADTVTETASEGVADGDVTDSESVSNASEMRYVTHSASVRNARNAALTTNQPSAQPPTTKDSSPRDADDSSSLTGEVHFDGNGNQTPTTKAEHHLEAFGAFWLAYPRAKSREKAKAAWIAAMERGADPKHIVDAAVTYANERHGEDPKYTPYPARWLDDGRYDDQPDQASANGRHLRAVSGGHQPFQPPTDHSVYRNGF